MSKQPVFTTQLGSTILPRQGSIPSTRQLKQLCFGNIILQQYDDQNRKFRNLPGIVIDEQQQCLLDNLLHVQTVQQATSFKVQRLNALCFYFADKISKRENRKFSHYVIFRGLKTGLFHNFDIVRKYILCPHPIYKGYYTFSEALQAARETLGYEFFIEPEQVFSYASVTKESTSELLGQHQSLIQQLETEVLQAQKKQDQQILQSQKQAAELKKKNIDLQRQNTELLQKLQQKEESLQYKERTIELLEQMGRKANDSKLQLQADKEASEDLMKKRTAQQLRCRLIDFPAQVTLSPLFSKWPEAEHIIGTKTEQSLLADLLEAQKPFLKIHFNEKGYLFKGEQIV